MKKYLTAIILIIVTISLTGCIKPYDTPEFVEIKPNQTAFVIPLEGSTSDQGKFESVDYLKDKQVATKRIRIPHKWIQTGRFYWQGKWIGTVRVIVVDRYPETREWFNDATRSSSGQSDGFVGESKDSIKFKVGLSATAQILEEDTATFLYQYAGKTLQQVMDSEVRNKIGTILLEQYGSMTIDEIRQSKSQVIEEVRIVAVPYFKERGITLSNIGYVGDLEYLQNDVQVAINKAFKAEQEQKAQAIINQTEIEKAEAEARAIEIRQQTLEKTLELRRLELQQIFLEKWNGTLPSTYVTDGESDLLLNMGTKEKQ